MVHSYLKPTLRQSFLMDLALRFSRPLTRLCILTIVATSFWSGTHLQAAQEPEASPTANSLESVALAQEPASTNGAFPEDGLYLFGQAPERDQIGQGYMLVESKGDQVFGALYFPQSSFDCFYGHVDDAQLAMNIVDSYSQETYPYNVALVSNTAIASTSPNGLPTMAPSGFHAIDTITDNDLRILEVCRSAVADRL